MVNVLDYLYRVGAVNSAGSAFSGWTVAMTEESGEFACDDCVSWHVREREREMRNILPPQLHLKLVR